MVEKTIYTKWIESKEKIKNEVKKSIEYNEGLYKQELKKERGEEEGEKKKGSEN